MKAPTGYIPVEHFDFIVHAIDVSEAEAGNANQY
jgi:hypothetical protein